MNGKTKICFSKLLLAISLLGLSPATGLAQAVHLHDSDSEQLAREALKTLSTLEAPEASVFQGLLRNLDAAHQRGLAVLWEKGQASLSSQADRMVEWNWSTFSKEVDQSQNEFIAAYKKAMQMRQECSLGLDKLENEIQAAEAQVRAAKKELARHDAGEKEVERAIEHYESAVGEIQKIAADQELAKKIKDLQLDKTQGYLKKLRDVAKNADTQAGLRPLYVDLGLSLAMLEIDELKVELEYNRWQLGAADDRLGRLRKVLGCRGIERASGLDPMKGTDPCDESNGGADRGDFGAILQAVRPGAASQGLNAFGVSGDELIMVTLQRLARKAHEEGMVPNASGGSKEFDKQFPKGVALRELLDLLAGYASIVGYQRFLLAAEESEDNFQSRRESIVLNQLEDKKLDILLGHALQGLLAYQGGGLRPWEILGMAGGIRP